MVAGGTVTVVVFLVAIFFFEPVSGAVSISGAAAGLAITGWQTGLRGLQLLLAPGIFVLLLGAMALLQIDDVILTASWPIAAAVSTPASRLGYLARLAVVAVAIVVLGWAVFVAVWMTTGLALLVVPFLIAWLLDAADRLVDRGRTQQA